MLLDSYGLPLAPSGGEAQNTQAVTEGRWNEGAGRFPTAYKSGDWTTQDTANWWPSMASADAAILPNRDMTAARVRDIIRNDPTAKAAIDKLADLIVGPGLRLSAKPDFRALGITPEDGYALGQQIETEWRIFTEDPRRTADAQRRLSMNGLFRLMARTWVSMNETTALLTWRDGPQRYSTCVQTIDPDRVSNPNGAINTLVMRGGVQMDTFGAPIGYHVREAAAGDYWAMAKAWTWTYVPKTTSWGRPVFIHGFEPEREGQTRAISPFAALLTRLRMIGKFADHELASAAANALFAAFVESDLPVDQITQQLTPSATTYADKIVRHFETHPAKLNGVRIPVMLPGTKIAMNSSPRQTTAFPLFQTAFLQGIASALGLSYEQLTMDWSKVNYSSARAALNEVWRTVRRISAQFTEQVVHPVYFAFLEEAFDKGYLKIPEGAPAFEDMPGAYMQARWVGPGRGYVDPVKEAEGAALRMETMISTLENEAAEQGYDHIDILDQTAREEAELKARGLTRMSVVAAVQSTKGPKPDSPDAEETTGVQTSGTGVQN